MKMSPREREIFQREIATRVDRGIERLQKEHKFSPYVWYRRIHADHISMSHLDRSPLGQLYGTYPEGARSIGLEPFDQKVAHLGFLPYLMVTGSYPGEQSGLLKLERDMLEDVWSRKILALQQDNAYLQIGDRFRFVQNQKFFTNTMKVIDLQTGRQATYDVQRDDFVKQLFRDLFQPRAKREPGKEALDLAKNINWNGIIYVPEDTYTGDDGHTWIRIRTLVGPEDTVHIRLEELQQEAVNV